MPQIELTIRHPAGLHARPASEFVRVASQYAAQINVTYGSKTVNAKSILGVLTLGVQSGATFQVAAEGPDAPQALVSLSALIERLSVEG